jgi:ABC-2 type transport system ATP-binding protein
MEEAQELAHRVGIIDHGDLIALGTREELTQQVGEKDTLVLHLAEGQDPAPLAEALRATPTVLRADASEGAVTVITDGAEELLAAAVTRANDLGLRIRSVDIQDPNLEAVFLHLTGRGLRD